MAENNSVKVEKNLYERTEGKETVPVAVNVVEIPNAGTDQLNNVVRMGISVMGSKWLGKYHGEEQAAWSGEMTFADLYDWFIETEGTRGSTKQDLALAEANKSLIHEAITALTVRLTSGKLAADKFADLVKVEQDKLAEATVKLAEAKKAHEAYLAKVAEAKAKREATEAEAKKAAAKS